MKSIIFVTTETSGSASLVRIIDVLASPPYAPLMEAFRPSGDKYTIAELAPDDHLYLIRGVMFFEPPVFDPRFRYIVNFRDPRDQLCNQYHWFLQHPEIVGTEEERARSAEERRAYAEQGIDACVLDMNREFVFDFTWEMQAAAEAGGDVLFVSYAQLCCAFDEMMARLVAFLGVSPSREQVNLVELERTGNLSANPNWVGQTWTGTDVAPGRHRRELKPETIETLNARWRPTLERLKALELPSLRSLYD